MCGAKLGCWGCEAEGKAPCSLGASRPNVPSSTRGTDPAKGDPITKRFTAKFPLPRLPGALSAWSLEAPWQEPGDNASRAPTGTPAGMGQERKPKDPLQGRCCRRCSRGFSGIRPFVKPEKARGSVWARPGQGRLLSVLLPEFQPVVPRRLLSCRTLCAGLCFLLAVPMSFQG